MRELATRREFKPGFREFPENCDEFWTMDAYIIRFRVWTGIYTDTRTVFKLHVSIFIS